MIDIHSHILPAIDDGAVDLTEAVTMCKLAAASGCEALIATPHQRHPSWWNTESVKLQVLLERIKKEVGETIQLYLGAEIRVDPTFLDLIDRIEGAGILPLAGSSYLLLEFPRRRLDVNPMKVVRRTREAGWRPIIAHPEFVEPLRKDLSMLRYLVEAGALLQITAMSVTANFGKEIQRCVLALIDSQLAHFVASDSHDSKSRPPGLEKARRAIVSRWGNAVARMLLFDNPRAVIENRPVEVSTAGSTSV